jgi:hypothetical protein
MSDKIITQKQIALLEYKLEESVRLIDQLSDLYARLANDHDKQGLRAMESDLSPLLKRYANFVKNTTIALTDLPTAESVLQQAKFDQKERTLAILDGKVYGMMEGLYKNVFGEPFQIDNDQMYELAKKRVASHLK